MRFKYYDIFETILKDYDIFETILKDYDIFEIILKDYDIFETILRFKQDHCLFVPSLKAPTSGCVRFTIKLFLWSHHPYNTSKYGQYMVNFVEPIPNVNRRGSMISLPCLSF